VIPLSIKLAYTALVALVVPFYWRNYGLANFLWFSDIALIVTVVALWTENRLLVSTMTVTVLLFEIVWNVAYFGRLLTGYRFGGMVEYMFDPSKSLFLRSLSLFHVVLPIVLLWATHRLGYDVRAFKATTLLCWVVLPVSYFVSTADQNLNWVFGPGKPQSLLHPLAYLAVSMVLLPALAFLPTHLLLARLFR
jgi:hypothetical protein